MGDVSFPTLDVRKVERCSLLRLDVPMSRTRLDTDLEAIQREAQLRRLGRDLHDQAAAISAETADALAAVVDRLAATTEYGRMVQQGLAEAAVAEASTRHLHRQQTLPL